MRFLVCCATRVGTTKVGRDLGSALNAIGHTVRYFDIDYIPLALRFVPAFLRKRYPYRRLVNFFTRRKLLRIFEARNLDVVLVVKGVQLPRQCIYDAKHCGIFTVRYWIDDPLDFRRGITNADSFDLICTNDKWSIERYHDKGVNRVVHLPSAVNTSLFYPAIKTRWEYSVTFVGTHSSYRESIICNLLEFNPQVFGSGWHRSKIPGGNIHRPVYGDALTSVYQRSKINLNIHNWIGVGSAVNLRLFEVPACRAFLLTDAPDELHQFFNAGVHIAVWGDIEDLKRKIADYLAKDAERDTIADAGFHWVRAHHSYESRAKFLTETISNLRTRTGAEGVQSSA